MQSVWKGLRAGEITKDTYGRLECTECSVRLAKREDPDDIGSVRSCPDCGREWQHIG